MKGANNANCNLRYKSSLRLTTFGTANKSFASNKLCLSSDLLF
jgi:hypothetical protein